MIEKIREYFIDNKIINCDEDKINLNVDFLSEKPTEFAIMKIPTNPIVESYINGDSLRQFQFQLISCNDYGIDVMQNVYNSSFYEKMYKKIELLNKEKKLPDIEGIQKIECLDDGAILSTTTNTARYSIEMRILYYEEVI